MSYGSHIHCYVTLSINDSSSGSFFKPSLFKKVLGGGHGAKRLIKYLTANSKDLKSIA